MDTVVSSLASAMTMETRLQLRQRLLRIGDQTTSAARIPSTTLLKPPLTQPNDAENEEDDDDASEEGDDGEEEEEDEGDDCSVGTTDSTSSTRANRSNKGVVPSSGVVKLLFSSSNPLGRHPTVCFEYPSLLNTTRTYPSLNADSNNSGMSGAIVAVKAQDLQLYFKTHWERNCVKNAFAAAGFSRTKKKWVEWHVAWAKHIPKDNFKLFRGGGEAPYRDMQVFNHFPDPWVLGRKDRLLKTLAGYRRRFGAEQYGFFPEGFNIPGDLDALARAIERDRASTTTSKPSAWIVKPPASSCGRGIRVVAAKDTDKLLADLKRDSGKAKRFKKTKKQSKRAATPEQPEMCKSKARQYVVQRYLDNPLLMGGFKFDLRLYVVVTSVDPLRIYLFEEGITRFCTAKYSLGNTSNRFGHLTNYSINKKNSSFVENENALQENVGSKWSLSALLKHLVAEKVLQDPDILRARIRDVICKTIIAAEAHLTPLHHQFVKKTQNLKCFELFGFDLMLDAQLNPWLIEVNVSPSLMGGSPLDKRVKGLLLSDIFHLVGLQIPISSIPEISLPSGFVKPDASATATEGTLDGDNSARNRTIADTTRANNRFSTSKALHELALDTNVKSFDTKHLEWFAPSDWDILDAMDDEMARAGNFERIFPNRKHPDETTRHSTLFTCQRYANALCCKWIQTPATIRARRHAFLSSSTSTVKDANRFSSRSLLSSARSTSSRKI